MKTAVTRMAIAILTLNSLFCLCMIPVSAQSDAEKRAEGKKISEQMLVALGGRARLSMIRDSVISSELRISRMGVTAKRIVYRKRTGKMRVDTRVEGMTIIMAFNGYTGWMLAPRSSSPLEMPAPLLEEMERKSIELEAQLDPETFNLTATFEGRKTVDGRDCTIIKQAYRDGYAATVYLDSNTYLPFKTVAVGLTDTLERAEMDAFFSDYRDVQGTRVPFSIRIVQDGKESAILSVLDYRYNTGLDDSLFEKP